MKLKLKVENDGLITDLPLVLAVYGIGSGKRDKG